MSKEKQEKSLLDLITAENLQEVNSDKKGLEELTKRFNEVTEFLFATDEVQKVLKEKDQRIAELEEQLANSIRPKFRIGQEVWETRPFMAWEVTSIKFEKHNGILYEIYQLGHKGTDDYNSCVLPSDNDRFFATKDEALKKLEEFQGE